MTELEQTKTNYEKYIFEKAQMIADYKQQNDVLQR
jgi:hypothetical protein